MNLKFQLPDSNYKAAEEVCKKGYVFQSDEMILKLPLIYSPRGNKYENNSIGAYRIVYSPQQSLFICEEATGESARGAISYTELFRTDKAIYIENFIKWTIVSEILSDDASDWIKESISTTDDDWETILFDLMKNVDLTEKECKYLEIDQKRAMTLRRSSNLGLI